MMRRLLIISACAMTVAGCGTLSAITDRIPFLGGGNSNTATQGERISVIAFDETVQVNDALKGVDFDIPAPVAVDAWNVPGGTPEQVVEHAAAAPDFEIAWRRGFGAGSNRARHVTAPPVEMGGKIFVMDGEATVAAIDANNGSVIWRRDLRPEAGGGFSLRVAGIGFGSRGDRTGFGGGIAASNGKLYVTSGFRFVTQLDAETGAVGWTTATSSPIHSAPNISGGRVFAITIDNELLSFDTATGAAGWTYQALIEPARILRASSPAISGDTLVAGFGSGELIALLAVNGNELWNEGLSRANRTNALSEIRDIAGRPVIYRGDVFAASHSGAFTATDLRTGTERWNLPVAAITTPLPAGDVVYIVSKAGEVICVSRETGQVYWIRELNSMEDLSNRQIKRLQKRPILWSSPILASNRLILSNSRGAVIALNPKTGETLKELELGGPGLIGPIAVKGKVFVVTDEATLVAFR
jgi:outer membrane protein assembly factor BamB